MEKEVHYDQSPPDPPAGLHTILAWLDQGFEQHPMDDALCFGKETLSYDELNKLSNKVAHYLASRGIARGDRVGICLDRSLEMIACVIGILKAGAAYVPLDPYYPVDRLKMMSEDARLSLLITHRVYAGWFETDFGPVVLWEHVEAEISHYPEDRPAIDINGEDVAYVIFTSGSTGRPKGIAMPHRALSNLIEWQLERPYFKGGAKVLQYSSISFDVSFQEIATTLASGGTLFLIKDQERRDSRQLLELIDKLEIERLFIPFVALRSLIEVAVYTGKLPGALKEVITAGEQLRVDADLRTFFSDLKGSVLENQYGPSETHVISAHLLGDDPAAWPDLPPIGTPIKNSDIYILNEDLEPVEDGETGELYLGGRNLSHGYIGREDLTRKSFIENPFEAAHEAVLYKTGDLGYYNQSGAIEFLGRADHQIKIRGYRVEPGEINSIAAEYPGISQCITHTVREAGRSIQLATYYIAQKDGEIDSKQFKSYLSDRLPEYMVPAFIIQLDSIPYTPSGKVNFKALPKPERRAAVREKEEVEYQSETERRIAAIWCELLGLQHIPRSSDFFDLGGDSLSAVTLFMEIEEQFGKYLPLSSLTQAPTIEELAMLIDGRNDDAGFSRFRSLQLLQRGSVHIPPLFLVHGGAGNVLMFKDLAKGLPPDQPVYAFQWPGWDGYEGEDDIIEMARFYKKELREAWPSGPYRLGGHCIGGIIAIEIANLLKAEGAEVLDPILVSDAPNLHSRHYYPGEPEKASTQRAAFRQIVNRLEAKMPDRSGNDESQKVESPGIQYSSIDKVSNRSKSQKRSLGSGEKGRRGNYSNRRFPVLAKYLPFYFKVGRMTLKVESKLQLLKIFLYRKLAIKIPVQDRYRYSTRSQVAAIRKHEKRIYEGDILYLKSEVVYGRQMGLQGWWDDLFFGFEELCSGQFDAYVIGGGHNDVLKNDLAHRIIREKMID